MFVHKSQIRKAHWAWDIGPNTQTGFVSDGRVTISDKVCTGPTEKLKSKT